MTCEVCSRKRENLGSTIKTAYCHASKRDICKDCCIKNGEKKCHWWTMCWGGIAN